MVAVNQKPPPPTQWPLHLGRAVGRSDDFFVLAYAPELDEHEKQTDPAHKAFTFICRFQATARSIVDRLKVRLEEVWQPPRGPLLSVGDPLGIIEIDPGGLREVALPFKSGYLMSIWGANDAHVFAAGGMLEPCALYREHGKWRQLPLPAGTAPIFDVRGLRENEVYFVGKEGQVHLWDGRQISRLPSPTTRPLAKLARLNDTYMCAAGHDGTLLMGNRNGWRIVPTQTETNLLSIGELDDKVYYGADGAVWSFDGQSPPVIAIDTPADWVNGLADGLLVTHVDKSKLYRAGTLVDLDTML